MDASRRPVGLNRLNTSRPGRDPTSIPPGPNLKPPLRASGPTREARAGGEGMKGNPP